MTEDAPVYIGPVERGLSLLCDRIIAVSEFERRHAIELGIAHKKVVVVPNGVRPYIPLERKAARDELGLADDHFVVGFVGRLTEQKNPVEAVEVIKRVRDNAVLAIVGDGPLTGAAEAAASALSGTVVFAGGRDAKPLLSAFDCLLCTSRYEGMPVTFLEAMNCGVPIVSYPVGGTDELIMEGTTGFVTNAEPRAAAAAIETLMNLRQFQKDTMSAACRIMAGEHSDTQMGLQTLAVYEEVLGR